MSTSLWFAAPLKARYGGKRGLLRHLYFQARYHSGGLRRFRCVDWGQVQRLVFVCAGNVCRSPYAEAVATAAGLTATSFGLNTDGATPANPAAVAAAHRRGIDLSRHRSRRVEEFEARGGDLLLCMEPAHCLAVERRLEVPERRLTLLGLWAAPRRAYLHDPHGLCEEYFDNCFGCIDSAVVAIGMRLGGAG